MKKILEVLQYGDTEIRFNTDIDVSSDLNQIYMIAFHAATTMMTKLWGGNERSVLAMIRALAIADFSVSVNREEMLEELGVAANELADTIQKITKEAAEKCGVEIKTFGPGVMPNNIKS